MEGSTNNIKFTSYNIKGFGADKYETVKDLLDKCDFLLLQETWKYEQSFIDIINNEFPGYDCVVKSSMNEHIPLIGRPSG